MTHFIEGFPDALATDSCRAVIDRFERDPRRGPSRTQARANPLVRSGTMLDISALPEWRDVVLEIDATIARHLPRYAEKFIGFQHLAKPDNHAISPALIERVDPGQGCGFHIDAGPWGTHDRVLATLIYLADIAEGGFTEFPYQGVRVQPRRGLLLMFPPFWTHLHRGVTPGAGVKYNVTNFVQVRPKASSAARPA